MATLSFLFEPIQQLSQLYATYQSGMAALEKIFQLLDTQPTLVDRPNAPYLGPIRGEVDRGGAVLVSSRAARRSDWTAPAVHDGDGDDPAGEVLALEHIDLSVPEGQTIALVGETGAGKSTMAKLAARFYDPTRGRVLVDGHDLREVSSHSLRSQMGIVPQEAYLYSGTVRENIAFGRPGR